MSCLNTIAKLTLQSWLIVICSLSSLSLTLHAQEQLAAKTADYSKIQSLIVDERLSDISIKSAQTLSLEHETIWHLHLENTKFVPSTIRYKIRWYDKKDKLIADSDWRRLRLEGNDVETITTAVPNSKADNLILFIKR